jgi:hypothetical protein
MLGQLLELRGRLQQLQQQVKQLQLEQQQQQQPAKVAAVAAGGKAASKRRTSNDAVSVGSRSTSPVPSGGATPQGEIDKQQREFEFCCTILLHTQHVEQLIINIAED